MLLLIAVFALGVLPQVRGAPADVEGVVVRWDEGLDALGRAAARAAPRIREEVSRRLGWMCEGLAAEVVIVHGHDRMREEARARVPDWAVGVAVSSRALIVIRADLLAAGFGGGVVPVLRHEWVHLAWGWRAGAKRRHLPLWAEEGIAEEIGGGVSVDAGAVLDIAVTFDRLLDFTDLEDRFPDDLEAADLAYKQSRSWIRFVAGKVGWKPVQEVLAGLLGEGPVADHRPGESAFEREVRIHTGRTVGDWHAAWRVALEEEAVPWYHLLFRDVQGLIIACLALVGAVAFAFLVRRRRRQIDRLPDGTLSPGEGKGI